MVWECLLLVLLYGKHVQGVPTFGPRELFIQPTKGEKTTTSCNQGQPIYQAILAFAVLLHRNPLLQVKWVLLGCLAIMLIYTCFLKQ